MTDNKKWNYILVISSFAVWIPFIYAYYGQISAMWGVVKFLLMLFLYIASMIITIVNLVIVLRKYAGREVNIVFTIFIICINLGYLGMSKIFFEMFLLTT